MKNNRNRFGRRAVAKSIFGDGNRPALGAPASRRHRGRWAPPDFGGFWPPESRRDAGSPRGYPVAIHKSSDFATALGPVDVISPQPHFASDDGPQSGLGVQVAPLLNLLEDARQSIP